jgi:hypothetical protein
MHLNEALIDDVTGGAIVNGRLEMTLLEDDYRRFALPPHTMILLDFCTGVTCKAVTAVERLDTGFCKISTAGPRVRLRMTSQVFNSVVLSAAAGDISQSSSRGEGWIDAGSNYPGVHLVTAGFDLNETKTSDGLVFRISGRLKQPSPNGIGFSSPEVGRFYVEGTIPWHTLALKGLDALGCHKFTPQGQLLRSRVDGEERNPLHLGDVMIAEGLTWPYVKGSVKLDRATGKRVSQSGAEIMNVHIHDDRIGFSEGSWFQLLTNGFYQSGAINRWFNFKWIGRLLLETALLSQDCWETYCEGDLLGDLSYETGYGDEPGDPLGQISQNISAMKVRAVLGNAGLTLHFDGTLDGFDPREFEVHRRRHNSKLVPWDQFELEAVLPWALLQVRDFALAKRRQAFV